MTVRNLDPEVKSRLRQRASRHGRSMEAEVRAVLAAAVMDESQGPDLASSIRRHFGDAPIDLDLPDRMGHPQRPVEFGP